MSAVVGASVLFSVSALLLVLLTLEEPKAVEACRRRHFGPEEERNIVCQCDLLEGCDRLALELAPAGSYLRVVSDLAGARWERKLVALRSPSTTTQGSAGDRVHYLAEVDTGKRLQQVAGYGGAFTDSAALVLRSLPRELEQRALEDYFGPQGLDYNLGRVPIAGTDMSTRPYSYDELDSTSSGGSGDEMDMELKHFRLQPEDLELRLPLIKRVNEMRAKRGLEGLKLMAASWSAPSWMKSNGHLVQGRLKGSPRSTPNFYGAYARYIIRFLDEWSKHNVTFWALSPQNEPHTPKRVGPIKINFNSVNFEPHEMADYLESALVPELLKSGRTSDQLALYIWDDTIDGLDRYTEACLASDLVRNYTRGLAIHWYSSGLRGSGYGWLKQLRQSLPQRYSFLSTEASFLGKPEPGAWWRGERYARDILENLRAGSLGWIDWNLALNTSGGPTWSHNILDAAILVDVEQARYYKNPMYYALAHVSRFVAAGSHVLVSSVVSKLKNLDQDEISLVAAEWPSQAATQTSKRQRQVALVMQNRAHEPRRMRLRLDGCLDEKEAQLQLDVELTAASLTSIVMGCDG